MDSSPSFKQALRIVIKRNIVRLALLFILLAVWWVMMAFRAGERYSVSPHTMAKVSLSRVDTPTRLLFSLNDPKEKKVVPAEILALDSSGLPEALHRQCQEKLLHQLDGQAVWIRSAYLGSAQQTVGKILVPSPQAGSPPDDIGLKMLREGCAFYCKRDEKYLSLADQKLYAEAQEQAKNSRLGVWADSSAKPSSQCTGP